MMPDCLFFANTLVDWLLVWDLGFTLIKALLAELLRIYWQSDGGYFTGVIDVGYREIEVSSKHLNRL
jgi:hypothetical protein